MTIHKEGYPTLLLGFVILFILNSSNYYFFPGLFSAMLILSILFYGFLVSFFRKPDRTIIDKDSNTLLSPCDGEIVVIEKVMETEFLKKECLQVSIFMSPLNVHINWYPTDAKVIYSKYHPGKYLAAWNPKASTENERTTVCFDVNDKQILLRQVAGALARRIVCYSKEGDIKKQGDELGFIKFGSRVDLYLPVDTELNVNIGDVVTGNRSVIANLNK
ncbi:MAG: phosphatidylserine decarboxylase family protein [Saprospiraceae bacterium]|nr:phosphatidylserine decarboxylase family protein [Saprospiraceae bacterium]